MQFVVDLLLIVLMDYFNPFLVGFLSAFLGLLAPSMLNMTAARFSIEKGRMAGLQFAAGAGTIVFVQSGIALIFAKYLLANPLVLTKLKILAIFVLLALSIFFFMQARKQNKLEVKKNRKGNHFVIGLTMSALNMLSIPFFLAMSTFASQKGWMQVKQPFTVFFALGAALGSFSLFALYAQFAIIISKRVNFIARNINYILSVLFIILAIITAIQVMKDL